MINLIIKKAGALGAEQRNKLEKQLTELALGSLSHRARAAKASLKKTHKWESASTSERDESAHRAE
jgi:hypothetical protein